MNRREFLKTTSASALWLGMHGSLARGTLLSGPPLSDPNPGTARILDLNLRTAAPLERMRDFYQGKLGFAVSQHDSKRITFRAGSSTLTFTKAGPDAEEPTYHFAFNIPENKVLSARDWQAERTALIVPEQEHLHDPRFPKSVIHFSNWNAHSVFFYDRQKTWWSTSPDMI